MNNAIAGLINVAVAIVGLGALAVLVGKNSKTSEVATATGNAFANAILAAQSPVLDNVLSLRPLTGHP